MKSRTVAGGRVTVQSGGIDFALDFAGVHLAEAAGVPKFRAEITAELDVLFVEEDVLAERRGTHDAEAKGVRAVFSNEVERVGRIAEALGHFAPDFVAHDAGEVNVREGGLAGVFEAGHDHAGDPEKKDVGTADEGGGGIEFFSGGFVHGCERPQPRGEPGVEDVGIAGEAVLLKNT